MPLNLGGSVYDATDPIGRLLFNVLAMIAEFEADLIRAHTRRQLEERFGVTRSTVYRAVERAARGSTATPLHPPHLPT